MRKAVKEKVTKKSKRKKKKLRKKYAVSFAVVILVIAAYSFVTRASIFSIKTVDISGTQKLSEDKILLYSGIAIGDNIVKLKSDDVKTNLMSEPYIKEVELEKKYPNKVLLSITEKKDVIMINGKKKVYLDSDSQVLSVEEHLKNYSVPVLEGLVTDSAVISHNIKYKNDIEEPEFKAFLKGISKRQINQNLTKAEITKKENLILHFKDKSKIKLGDFENMEYKFNYLSKIIEDLKEKGKVFETVDFTRGNKVIVEEKLVREEK